MSDYSAAAAVIEKFRGVLAARPARLLWASTGTLAALLIVLRFLFAKKKTGKYIVDLSSVGSPAAQGKDSEEYDVIIVGGGNAFREMPLWIGL